MRLDLLSSAFIYRRYRYEFYDFREFGMKGCLLIPLRQVEPLYTCNCQDTVHFITAASYGGRVGANMQEFKLSLCTQNKTILQNFLQ